MALGREGHIGVSRQSSFGTAFTGSAYYVPFVSETLTLAKGQIEPENILARYDPALTIEGLNTVEGDIAVEMNPIAIGTFLRAFTGADTTTLVDSVVRHKFLPVQTLFDDKGNALNPYTIEVYRGVGQSFFYNSAIANRLEIAVEPGEITRATVGWIGQTSSLAAKSTPTFPAGDPWTWDQASVSMAGVAFQEYEAVTMTFENQLEGVPVLDNTKIVNRVVRNGTRTCRVSGTADFATNSEYVEFINQTTRRLVVTLRGAETIATSYRSVLEIDIPKLKYSTFPPTISGPNRITVGWEGTGEFDTTSSYSFQFTLTNTKTGLY